MATTEAKIDAVSRAIDPEAWDATRHLPTGNGVLEMLARREAANAAAVRALDALAALPA